jgi:hypothetical protein
MPNIYVLYTNYNGKPCLVPIKPTEGGSEKVNKIKTEEKIEEERAIVSNFLYL